MKENISFNLVYKAPQQRWYIDSPDIPGCWLSGQDFMQLMEDLRPAANRLIKLNKMNDVPRIKLEARK